MNVYASEFGATLRRLRLARKWSLEQLADEVHYAKSYLSRVENGTKRGSAQLARLCDSALGGEGVLNAFFAEHDADGGTTGNLAAHGEEAEPRLGVARIDAGALDAVEALLSAFQQQGRRADARLVVPGLLRYTATLIEARPVVAGTVRRRQLWLAARYSEFAGWMLQECGATSAALRWTDVAVDLAGAASDATMGAHALVRRALFALYRGDHEVTVELATRAAQAAGATPQIRAWALQREAQGHALAGRAGPVRVALERAAELGTRIGPESRASSLGPTVTVDPVLLTRAWCAYDLGQPAEAAHLLDRAVADIPRESRRSRARYGTRAALAHASVGDVTSACAAVRRVLPDVMSVRSATIAPDLCLLNRTLIRWRRHDEVVAILPDMSAALAVLTVRPRPDPPAPRRRTSSGSS